MENNNRYLALILDMGGVLLRTENPRPRTNLARRFGLTMKELERLVYASDTANLATWGTIPAEQHWARVCAELGIPIADLGAFQDEFWGGDTLDRGLVDWVKGLRPEVKTGLLSNAFSDARTSVQSYHQFFDAFDVTVFSAELKLAKPDPRIYQWILDQLGIEARRAVFVDDFFENVTAARGLGMTGVHFQEHEQALNELRGLFE